jgi:mycothiol synthase
MPDLPAPVDDLTWRPASPDDAEALARLHAACYEVDGGYLMVAAEFANELTHPANDARRDGLVAVDAGGEVVAFGMVHLSGGDRSKHRAFPWGEVHPAHRRRGLGSALQTWMDARAAERLGAFDDGLPRVIRVGAYDHQSDRLRLFARFGYEPSRYFIEMIRDLSMPFPPVPDIGGNEVMGWSETTKEAALTVHNEAFADHWGSEPITPAAWDHRFDEFFLPDASFVAYDDDRPVAYLVSSMYPHDFSSRGRTEAWIEGLGTVPSHRGRGLASRLVAEAMARFRDRGLDYAALTADAENTTGAVGIYERLGFGVEKTSITCTKWLE